MYNYVNENEPGSSFSYYSLHFSRRTEHRSCLRDVYVMQLNQLKQFMRYAALILTYATGCHKLCYAQTKAN